MRKDMQSGTLDDLANYLEDEIAQAGGVMSACNTTGTATKPDEGDEPIMAYSESDEWMGPEMFNARRKGWKYNLPDDISSNLRTAIEDDDIDGTQSALREAVAWCYDNVPGAEDDHDLSEIQDELDFYSPEYEDEDEDFENLNYILDEFFDYCDMNRIWIGGI